MLKKSEYIVWMYYTRSDKTADMRWAELSQAALNTLDE